MNRIVRFFRFLTDLIMVTRPVVLIPVWGFSALGFIAAARLDPKNNIIQTCHLVTLSNYCSILLFSVSVAAVYVINQIADIEADKKNGGLPLIASGIVSVRSSITLIFICSAVSIGIPLVTDQFFISLASIATLAIGYIYSFKPFRFSGKPILDFLSNGLGYGVISFATGWYLCGRTPFNITFAYASLPYFFLMCAGSISSTLPDINGDREDKKFTTAVVFGPIISHTLAFMFLLSAAITGIINNDMVAILCAVASIPFYTGFYLKRNTFFMESTYKIGGGLCMITAFMALPLFIPISVIVFFVTWLYFRIRHGISYPSLTSVQSPKNHS